MHPAQVPVVAAVPCHADAQPVVGLVVLAGSLVRVGPFVADVDFLRLAHVHGGRAQKVVVEFNVVDPILNGHAPRPRRRRVRGDFPSAVHQHVLDEPIFRRKFTRFEALCHRQVHVPGVQHHHGILEGVAGLSPLVGNGERDVVAAWGVEGVVQFPGARFCVAVAELPRPSGHPVVTLIGELHAVAHTNDLAVGHELHGAQVVGPGHACGLQIGLGGQLVPLGSSRERRGAHALLLALGKHVATVAVLHVILDVVQGPTAFAVDVAGRPTQGVGGVVHQVVFVAVFRLPRVVAVAPRVAKVEPVAHLVGQRP